MLPHYDGRAVSPFPAAFRVVCRTVGRVISRFRGVSVRPAD